MRSLIVRFGSCIGAMLIISCQSAISSEPGGQEQTVRVLAGGLEHEVSIVTEPTTLPTPPRVIITSLIRNRDDVAREVRMRSCMFLSDDFVSDANLVRYEPTVQCEAVETVSILAPGATTPALTQMFGIESPSGTYQVSVRHLLAPERRTAVPIELR